MTKNKDEIQQWIKENVAICVEQGYRVTPIYQDRPPQKFGNGQNYSDPNSREWQGAIAIGVCLDEAVLLDYDGNKADENSEQIIDLETLAATFGLDELPYPVQENDTGRSLHFLFTRKKEKVTFQSKDGWLPYIDIKTGNQLMHLKPHKIINDGELPKKRALPRWPETIKRAMTEREYVDAPAMEPTEARVNVAKADLENGVNLHASARTIVNAMVFEGKEKETILNYFSEIRPLIENRDFERVNRFYNSELQGLVNSALQKYGNRSGDVFDNLEGDYWSDHVLLTQSNTVLNISSSAEISVQAFNLSSLDQNCQVEQANGNMRTVSAIEYLIRHKRRPAMYAAQYDPTEPLFFERDNLAFVNSYRPQSVPKPADDWENHPAWRTVENHLLTMFHEKEMGQKVIEWMAYNVQNAGQKILWAPIICGVQGDGKSTIFNIMRAVMGNCNVKDVSTNEIFSSFNGYASGACVAALEEIRVKGHNRHEVMNQLKPLLTNPVVSIVKKGRDALNVKNVTNYIGFTNFADALVLDDDDRRWAVFFTKFESREELMKERNFSFWEVLHNAYREHAGVIRSWLLSVNVDYFNPKAPPETNASHKQRMIYESRTDDQKAMIEVIELNPNRRVVTAKMLMAESRDFNLKMSLHAIGRLLMSLGWIKYKPVKLHGKTTNVWLSKRVWENLKIAEKDHENVMRICREEVPSDDILKSFGSDYNQW